MPTFDYEFTVDAPQAAVADFHYSSSVKALTPFPIIVRIHEFEPLGEGSKADFTLWFGPVPVNWKVVHSHVGRNGFTDTQVQGPLQNWRHEHRFIAVDEQTTRVQEHIVYEYKPGIAGLFNRLMFSAPALTMLFTARKMITRKHVGKFVPETVR
jgi:ligand-binding SRPBCC domain-containing protein